LRRRNARAISGLKTNSAVKAKPAHARDATACKIGATCPINRDPSPALANLDPLDVIGTNADLVVMARVDGIRRGELWRWLFPRASHTGRRTSARTNLAFEHFAKERCILPAAAFPWYRVQGHKAQAPWWRHGEREQRVPKQLIAAVLAEVSERGPVSARELTDHGTVDPIDWSGWKGTAKATSMALEILWTRCDIVVAGRAGDGSKLYDIPQRSLGLGALAVPAGDVVLKLNAPTHFEADHEAEALARWDGAGAVRRRTLAQGRAWSHADCGACARSAIGARPGAYHTKIDTHRRCGADAPSGLHLAAGLQVDDGEHERP